MGLFDFLSGSPSFSQMPGMRGPERHMSEIARLLLAYAQGVPGSGQDQAGLAMANARAGQAYGQGQQQLLASLTPGSAGYNGAAADALGRFQSAKAAGETAAYTNMLNEDQQRRWATLQQALGAFQNLAQTKLNGTVVTQNPGLGGLLAQGASLYGQISGLGKPAAAAKPAFPLDAQQVQDLMSGYGGLIGGAYGQSYGGNDTAPGAGISDWLKYPGGGAGGPFGGNGF